MEATIGAKPEKKPWGKREWGLCLLAAFVAWCAISFYQIVNKPMSYEECVMQNIKPGDSDRGAAVKADACRKMFPKNPYDVFDK